MVYSTIRYTQHRGSHSVTIVDGLVKVIQKTEFLEVNHTDFYSHVSLINNIVSKDKFEILAEFDNLSSTEANGSSKELFINEKFGEIIKANSEKKNTLISRNMTDKGCQVNFEAMNIEICYRKGAWLFKINKYLEMKFLREQVSEMNLLLEVFF